MNWKVGDDVEVRNAPGVWLLATLAEKGRFNNAGYWRVNILSQGYAWVLIKDIRIPEACVITSELNAAVTERDIWQQKYIYERALHDEATIERDQYRERAIIAEQEVTRLRSELTIWRDEALIELRASHASHRQDAYAMWWRLNSIIENVDTKDIQ